MRLTLPATAESVPVARHEVARLVRASGASERALADVALAVSEACTNVVLHAYRDHDVPGTLSLDATLHDGELEVVVSDEGSGVHPRDDSPGLGMGMALMAAVATGVQLDHDGAATRVRLTFDLRLAHADTGEQPAESVAAEPGRPLVDADRSAPQVTDRD
ncbi:ATP-binding protein [Conexibacter sp. CPCC 206217]|uniref:ATP-binding protein n=1 Tax=Conexibacter sp. CPCC 206217 TaxID=3064574 RepID=UPI002721E2FE|nr:ATP-binding protein [Conexibacter sp. CPCC 206217]MDO8213660.1 ATP-binding protein [Conexibacter sp. CPCC 206217]